MVYGLDFYFWPIKYFYSPTRTPQTYKAPNPESFLFSQSPKKLSETLSKNIILDKP